MVTKFRDSAERLWRMFYRLDFHAFAKESAFHLLVIVAIALLFYGIESFIELFARDIDNVVDVVMAIASTFVFLWVRSIFKNAQLAATLRERSETYSAELEGRVAEKTERIRQMHDAQSKFLAEIAHEFQTPLAILRGNLGVLAAAPDVHATYVATTTLDRLSRLVSNLLDAAKIKSSRGESRPETVDLVALAKAVREDCELLAADKNIAISLGGSVTDGDLSTGGDSPILVAGNKDKLKEVLLNLLSNALKFTPAGGKIAISARRRNNDEAELVVADTGRGISPDRISNLFERFYVIEGSAAIHASHGLGLHICRQIVEAHGGTIVAESEAGCGTRFVIHLPLVPAMV